MAAKPKTKNQILTEISEETNLPKKDVASVIDTMVQMAYKEANVGFTIPGLGKLVVVDRKAREGRNPATGEKIQIPAKKVLKFRIAKAAKDAIG